MREASLAVVFDPTRKKILLIKRRDVPVWVLPGGGIDSHETPEEAVVREVWEETGLRINIARKIAEYFPLNRLAAPTHVYECVVRDGRMRTGDETRALDFWPLDQLTNEVFIVHRDWIADALENNGIFFKKGIARVTYWGLLRYAFCHPFIFSRFVWTTLTKG